MLCTQKCSVNSPITHHGDRAPRGALVQGRAARAWNSDQGGPEGPHVPLLPIPGASPWISPRLQRSHSWVVEEEEER